MIKKHIAIIGGGPAGLAAAEALSGKNYAITIYEAMPTPARKFLWAGKSGLNITHAEPFELFCTRFGKASNHLANALEAFSPTAIQQWSADLGVETFVGSSGRIFPKTMKASPLLRAWLARLNDAGVQLRTRHKWCGFDGEKLLFGTPDGVVSFQPDATILALGGASYKRLGSTADWVPYLEQKQIEITPFQPANCGFDVNWSDYFSSKFAGDPVKSVAVNFDGTSTKGEFVVSKTGIEGSLIYTHAAHLRDQLQNGGKTFLELDLVPGKTAEQLTNSFERQNPKHSLSNRLRKGAKLTGVKAALVRELCPDASKYTLEDLAKTLKSLRLPILRARPIDEAISSAGGIAWHQLDEHFMLQQLPGTFVAGEMVDWEAPTGGYLITACLATGRAAGLGAHHWLSNPNEL